MSRPNYSIPENPRYNPVIPSLLDQDPASATNTFNPLFLRLIENAHAIKLAAETLQLQVSVLTGGHVARAVGTHANLPNGFDFLPGTRIAVRADETHGGLSTLYELNTEGQWIFIGEMAGSVFSNLFSQIADSVFAHDTDPQAHGSQFQSIKNDIKQLTYMIQQLQLGPAGSFLGAGAYLGADDSILTK